MQRTYEIMFIVRPDILDEDLDKLIAGLEANITQGGGSIKSMEKLGRRKLAYMVKKFNDGNYVLLDDQRRWFAGGRDRAPAARLRAGDQVHLRPHGRRREASGQDQGHPRHAQEAQRPAGGNCSGSGRASARAGGRSSQRLINF